LEGFRKALPRDFWFSFTEVYWVFSDATNTYRQACGRVRMPSNEKEMSGKEETLFCLIHTDSADSTILIMVDEWPAFKEICPVELSVTAEMAWISTMTLPMINMIGFRRPADKASQFHQTLEQDDSVCLQIWKAGDRAIEVSRTIQWACGTEPRYVQGQPKLITAHLQPKDFKPLIRKIFWFTTRDRILLQTRLSKAQKHLVHSMASKLDAKSTCDTAAMDAIWQEVRSCGPDSPEFLSALSQIPTDIALAGDAGSGEKWEFMMLGEFQYGEAKEDVTCFFAKVSSKSWRIVVHRNLVTVQCDPMIDVPVRIWMAQSGFAVEPHVADAVRDRIILDPYRSRYIANLLERPVNALPKECTRSGFVMPQSLKHAMDVEDSYRKLIDRVDSQSAAMAAAAGTASTSTSTSSSSSSSLSSDATASTLPWLSSLSLGSTTTASPVKAPLKRAVAASPAKTPLKRERAAKGTPKKSALSTVAAVESPSPAKTPLNKPSNQTPKRPNGKPGKPKRTAASSPVPVSSSSSALSPTPTLTSSDPMEAKIVELQDTFKRLTSQIKAKEVAARLAAAAAATTTKTATTKDTTEQTASTASTPSILSSSSGDGDDAKDKNAIDFYKRQMSTSAMAFLRLITDEFKALGERMQRESDSEDIPNDVIDMFNLLQRRTTQFATLLDSFDSKEWLSSEDYSEWSSLQQQLKGIAKFMSQVGIADPVAPPAAVDTASPAVVTS